MKLYSQYLKALELLERESDRFWMRNNVFLLVQGAMIAFYSKAPPDALFNLLVSIEGLFLAALWIGVLTQGANYVRRWDDVVRELEARLEALFGDKFVGLKRLNDIAKSREKPGNIRLLDKRTTVLIRYFIISLLIFWEILVIYHLTKLQIVSALAYYLEAKAHIGAFP